MADHARSPDSGPDSTPEALAGRVRRLDAASLPGVEQFDGEEIRGGARLAVLPSAFNPPTEAHLALMRHAAETLFARPAALLTTRNVSKGREGAPMVHRVGMLLAAREVMPDLAVLVANTARFVDQARVLRERFPDATFDFVAGYDTLVRLFDSTFYLDMDAELEEFFAHHRLLATNRGPNDLAAVEQFLGVHASQFAERVTPLEIAEEHAALSSTDARESAPHALPGVPEPVRRYIREAGLYGE